MEEPGQFTAPTKGVYVFDWTITVDNGDMFFTEIVKTALLSDITTVLLNAKATSAIAPPPAG